MKTRIALTSIILMLLALPSEAKTVRIARVSADLMTDVHNLDNVDKLIDANQVGIDIFQGRKLTITPDQELIIRGGRESIKEELEKLLTRHDHAFVQLQPIGNLDVTGCRFKRNDVTTYVMLRASSFGGAKVCTRGLPVGDRETYNVDIEKLIAAVGRMRDKDVDKPSAADFQ